MKYKCDNCKYLVHDKPTEEWPFAEQHCAKIHWGGVGKGDKDPEEDPWKDCNDFLQATPNI
jgi:hypothetical protein